MGWRCWSWVFSFSQVSSALINPQQVKLWQNSFSWRAALVKKHRILWHISKWFLSPTPLQKHKGFFSDDHRENPVAVLEVNFTKVWRLPYDRVLLEFLNFRRVHIEPATNHQLQFRFSYPSTGSCRDVWSCQLWFSASACLSSFWCNGLVCDLTSLADLKRIVDFSVCWAFYLLVGQSGDF